MKSSTKGYKQRSIKEINCSRCGSTMKVDEDTVSGICWRCVATNNF